MPGMTSKKSNQISECLPEHIPCFLSEKTKPTPFAIETNYDKPRYALFLKGPDSSDTVKGT
jgi:hypothetical protein